MQKTVLIAALLLTGCRATIPSATLPPQPVSFLARAHSHNDYLHARPLQDALEQGFGSVEADIHLTGNQLWIGHLIAWNPNLTLQSLYLDPLRARIKSNGGWVYAPGEVLTLLIDVKTDTKATYDVLSGVLAGYADILTAVKDGQIIPGPVKVVITGNRDRELMRGQNPRYAFFEGFMTDLQGTESAVLVPAVAEQWSKVIRWNGTGDMPADQRQKLQTIARQAREQGRTLRLWDAPDNPNTWAELLKADVGFINTDHLKELREFLLKNDPAVKK